MQSPRSEDGPRTATTAVGRLKIWTIVALAAIVIVSLILATN